MLMLQLTLERIGRSDKCQLNLPFESNLCGILIAANQTQSGRGLSQSLKSHVKKTPRLRTSLYGSHKRLPCCRQNTLNSLFRFGEENPRECQESVEVCCTVPKDPQFVPKPTPDPTKIRGCGYRNPEGLSVRVTGDVSVYYLQYHQPVSGQEVIYTENEN